MPRETLNTRVTTLEGTMKEIAKAHLKLTNTVNHLAEVQSHYETEARQRDKQTDERIGKLVSAIGELITQMKESRQ